MDRQPLASITQTHGAWKSQTLELFDDELRISYRSGMNASRRTVPLEVFDTNDSEGRVFPPGTRWGFLVCAAAALAFLGIAGAQALQAGRAPSWALWTGIAAVAAAAVSGALHRALAYDAIYFYHAYTGDFLCALRFDRPSPGDVRAFFDRLKAQAKKRFESMKEEAEMPSVARELRGLHDLREKKVITDAEFESKKDELLEELLRD